MISQETVRQILDTAQIEEVIGDFVTLRRKGAEFWACCPFHDEKTPSFHIMPARGQYYCFGCHKGGSAVGFIMDYEHMSYVEALRYLARKYGIEVMEKEESAEEMAARQRNESLMLVSEFAGKFFRDQLETPEGRSVGKAYFHARGLEDGTIEKYGLGWAPSGRQALADAAKKAGYKEEYLLETGLCVRYDNDTSLHDRFCERVVFPIHSMSGRIIAFGARTLKAKEAGLPYAKYVNSKESDIYVKNRSLYGIWFAKKAMGDKDKCYLVEGYLDVLSLHQLGITNVVASSGTALTEGQIRMIKRFTKNVTIMYDGDEAGIHATLRGIDMFLKEGMSVRVVLIPDGDDPDSYARKHSLEEVEQFLDSGEQDFVSFLASRLLSGTENEPLRRADAINEIADTIAIVPDPVARSTFITYLDERYKIHEGALESRVSQTRRRLVTEEERAAERVSGQKKDTGGAVSLRQEGDVAGVPTGLDSLEENRTMGRAERDLLSFILAYGTAPLEFQRDSEFFRPEEKEACTVFDFISQSLAEDGAGFANKAYGEVFERYSEDYYAGYAQEEIVKRMLDGADRTVAYVASQLSNEERYDLTVRNLRDSMMSRGSWLTKFVPKAILVYQQSRIESALESLKASLREAQESSDRDRELQIMTRIVQTRKLLNAVNVRLGR